MLLNMPSTINKDVMIIIIIVIIIHIDPRYGGGSHSTGETDPGICCTEGPFCHRSFSTDPVPKCE